MSPRPYTAAWYVDRREKNMRAARNWLAQYLNSGDPGSLHQMRVRVQMARRNNHDALRARRDGKP